MATITNGVAATQQLGQSVEGKVQDAQAAIAKYKDDPQTLQGVLMQIELDQQTLQKCEDHMEKITTTANEFPSAQQAS